MTSLQIVVGILLTLAFLAFIGITVYDPVCKFKKKQEPERSIREANQTALPQEQGRGSPALDQASVTEYEVVTDEGTDQVIIRANRPLINQGEEKYDSNRFRDSILGTLDV